MSDAQKSFVADSATMLARAYAYRESRSKAYVIYNYTLPVGMALYYDCAELNAYDLSQLFIDERYQGNGFGIEATKQILDKMKSDSNYDKVILCYIEGNEAARNMYEKLGFTLAGDRDKDEIRLSA